MNSFHALILTFTSIQKLVRTSWRLEKEQSNEGKDESNELSKACVWVRPCWVSTYCSCILYIYVFIYSSPLLFCAKLTWTVAQTCDHLIPSWVQLILGPLGARLWFLCDHHTPSQLPQVQTERSPWAVAAPVRCSAAVAQFDQVGVRHRVRTEVGPETPGRLDMEQPASTCPGPLMGGPRGLTSAQDNTLALDRQTQHAGCLHDEEPSWGQTSTPVCQQELRGSKAPLASVQTWGRSTNVELNRSLSINRVYSFIFIACGHKLKML